MEHTCRPNGAHVGALDWPPYAEPGEIVKIKGVTRWGRVDLLHRCCGVIDVAFAQGADRSPLVQPLTLADVENAYGDYPANMPPRGYCIPGAWPRTHAA